MISYGSVCSGIEAASVAWDGLGWKAAWFAEIEKFPAAVLAHHYPDVANLGDMTKIAAMVRAGTVTAPDVMVGGTPCQAFSIAGLRKSLDDPRGQLTLSYVDLANAIDERRASEGKEPAVHLWENVPGSLSTEDNAFGYFLAGMAGEDEPFEPGQRPEPGKTSKFWRWNKKNGKHIPKWSKSGFIAGRQRQLAWRVIDAQYYGVPQRRRRVFIVASARNDFDPAKILLEFGGMRRDSAPSREPGAAVAALTANGVGVGGADDNQAQAGHIISAFGGGNCSGALDVAACLTAKGQRIDFDVETFAVHGTQDPDVLDSLAHTIGRNQGQENAVLAFSSKDYGGDVSVDISPTLRAGGHGESHANAGAPPAIVYALQDTTGRDKAQNGKGWQEESGFTLDSRPCADAVATVALRGRDGGATAELGDDVAGTLRASSGGGDKAHIMHQMMVRRLTPVECERLQGFPDNHTLIPWRGKNAADCPDGPRYKAIGNSMAVPVMRWIGERIAANLNVVVDIAREVPAAQLPKKKARKKAPAGVAAGYQRPFLKWAGGKFSALETIFANLPAGGRLIEPFVGGGSVFQNARYARNLLNDINPDLINLYRQLQGSPDAVIRTAQALVERCDNNGAYIAIRNEFNAREAHAVRHAALFLALMRTCFNGLCRYNQRNEFNVGWNKKRVNFFPTEALQAFAANHQHSEFMCGGFEEIIGRAADGDVIFCDPPYEPMPDTNGFTNYSGTNFTMKDQMKLVECLIAAKKRGASVVITNSSALRILYLYLGNGLKLAPLKARRSVSCKGDTRETVTDIIATF